MRHKNIFIFALLLVVSFGCKSTSYKNQKGNNMKNEAFTFDHFRIETDMMNREEVYVGEKTDNGTYLECFVPIKHYNYETKKNEERKMMVKAIAGDQQLYDEVCKLFEECDVKSWDGFFGDKPENGREFGNMSFQFILTAPKKTIMARGDNDFPETFDKLMDGIDIIFKNNEAVKTEKAPIAFQSFRIEEHGTMAEEEVYVAEKTGDNVHVEYYICRKKWNNDTKDYDETKIRSQAKDGDQQLYDEVCKLLAECAVDEWSGFHGENPPGLYDGSSMQFEATLTDGTKIGASGTNNFPVKYWELKQGIKRILSDKE